MNRAALFVLSFSCALLTACDGIAYTPTPPAETSAECNTVVAGETVDPGVACYNAEPQQLTGEDFGDSHSLGWVVAARHDLCGVVDFRHDEWSDGNIDICGERYKPYFQGQVVAAGENNGTSGQELRAMEREFSDSTKRRNIVTYNSGYHDMVRRSEYGLTQTSLDAYRNNMEAIAQLLEQHADVVIWVDSAPMPWERGYAGSAWVLAKDIPVYNAIGREVAREHGFYIMNYSDDPQHLPNQNLHFTGTGYGDIGAQVASCVLAALNQQETEFCHH